MTKLIGYDDLRDYQKECVETLNRIRSGNHLVQMATGLGKTVVFSNIDRPGRTLILAHREELINQPVKYFDEPVGFEQSTRRSNGERIVCASVQSLVRRLDRFSPDDFDMIITDEAHHAVAPSYQKIYEYFNPRVHFGFTATPNRGDKQGLGKVFQDIVFERDIRWGIANNYLTDIRCLRIDIGFDISKVKRNRDDYNLHDLAAAVDIEDQNEAVAEAYYEHHVGQTLIFATTVQHAENIASLIDGAVVVSADTPNREEIIQAFTERKIPCIVNCMVFTEGTDMPLIETVIIARPTKNASLYAQMVGRGWRLHPDKKYLTLIDCVGVSEKNDICTAPSLFGIELTPKQYKEIGENSDGIMLTRIEPEIAKHYAWRITAREIDIFEKTWGVKTYDVNWTKMPSGDFVLSMGGAFNADKVKGEPPKVNLKITVKAPDLIGNTSVIFEARMRTAEGRVATKREETKVMPLQDAFSLVYVRLNNPNKIYKHFRNLWDKNKSLWRLGPASEKQIEMIKKLMVKYPDRVAGIEFNKLTKGEAGTIMDILLEKNSDYYTQNPLPTEGRTFL